MFGDVQEYLVSRGVSREKIDAHGMGKTPPILGPIRAQKDLDERIISLLLTNGTELEVRGEIAHGGKAVKTTLADKVVWGQ